MDKEEILKYARIFSTAKGDTHKIHFVNENKTINEPDLWKEVLNLIDELQKQNREYEYTITGMVQTREDYFIPKYKIKDKMKEYLFKAVATESIRVARQTTKEEDEEIMLCRTVAEILSELLGESNE